MHNFQTNTYIEDPWHVLYVYCSSYTQIYERDFNPSLYSSLFILIRKITFQSRQHTMLINFNQKQVS